MSAAETRVNFDYLNENEKEAFQDLRRNIQYLSVGSRLKTITVTSCLPREGKSATARKLAVAMAEMRLKVLLIDANLCKQGNLKKNLGESHVGLSNLLTGGSTLQEAITATTVENLAFMSSGPVLSNSSELIELKNFRKFLSSFDEAYDIVIIDTPPVGSVIDGALIASQTDGAILVVQHNATNYKKVLIVKEQLEKMNARILGVVLNRINRREYKKLRSRFLGGG